jgi:dTDP-L-rhamnose 4-epimerase
LRLGAAIATVARFMMTRGTALVTGGAGFIGSHIADALLERGWRVRALDSLDPQVHGEGHPPGWRPDYLAPAVELLAGDVADPEAVAKALEGADVLLHMAARVGVGQSMYDIERYSRANDLGCAVVLDAVANRFRGSVKAMVVASSMSIYGEGAYVDEDGRPAPSRMRPDAQLARREWEPVHPGTGRPLRPVPTPEDKALDPRSVYSVQKRSHEEMFLAVGRAYGIPSTAPRFFNAYGPRQALSNPYTGVAAIFCSRLLNGNAPLVFEDGRQARDFVHVRDIARACALALESPAAAGEAINLGSGRPMPIGELALLLRDRLRPDASEEEKARLAPRIPGEYRRGDIRHCYADISKAKRLLGWEPEIPFEEGLGGLIEWIKSQERPADRVGQAHRELAERGLAQ